MDARLSLITLGVASIGVSRQFYEHFGFVASTVGIDNIVFLQLWSIGLPLYTRALLTEDANVQDSTPGFLGITIVYNARAQHEVDVVLDEAVSVGGRLVKPARDVFWGDYSGCFANLEDQPWDMVYNPLFEIHSDGAPSLQ